MRALVFGIGLAVAGAVAVGGLGIRAGKAAEKEYKPKVTVKTLIQESMAGVKGKNVIIKHFSLPPGHVGGKHVHPGLVYVYVLEGALIIEVKGQGTQTVSAGGIYKEPLGRVMQVRNLSAKGWTKIVVFQIGDKGKPMMIKAK